jgi:hypothetical protein
MRLKTTSVVCGFVFLLCLAALPLIAYAGGRSCMPLSLFLFPAEIAPSGIGLITFLILMVAVIRSLITRKDRTWALSAMAVVILATTAYWNWAGRLPGFLEGLRDRFAAQVGYPKLREFAREVLAGTPLTTSEGIIEGPGRSEPKSDEQARAWDDLVSRYPFLAWTNSAGLIVARDGVAELHWGSPLVGHWGVQVAPEGTVKDLTEEDRGTSLRGAKDIQFVYYWD